MTRAGSGLGSRARTVDDHELLLQDLRSSPPITCSAKRGSGGCSSARVRWVRWSTFTYTDAIVRTTGRRWSAPAPGYAQCPLHKPVTLVGTPVPLPVGGSPRRVAVAPVLSAYDLTCCSVYGLMGRSVLAS